MPLTTTPLITFKVDDVTPAATLLAETKTHLALRSMLHSDIESCCDYHGTVVHGTEYHALLAAVHTAFSQHRPLILSPDMIWIAILQGLAQHMTLHAERLRKNFVQHQDRLILKVDVSHFAKGSPENPWEEAFARWTSQIRTHIGPTLHDHLIADFSTTAPLEKAVSQIVMMDIFERYFRYGAVSICGIPEITLEGTVEDWQRLRTKLDALTPFDMEWWIQELRPICNEFIAAARGTINLKHWQSICKLQEEYGGDIINGWIAKLFPYLRATGQGPARIQNKAWSFSTLDAPTGLSKVPFAWDILKPGEPDRHYAMEVIGGFVGAQQNKETMALRPRVGWAVRERPKELVAIDRLDRTCETSPGFNTESHARGAQPRAFFAGLPEDAAKFFHTSNGVRMRDDRGRLRFDILPLEKWETVLGSSDWRQTKQLEEQYGTAAHWVRFCNLAEKAFLALDLKTRFIEDDEAKRAFSDLFRKWYPIVKEEEDRIKAEVDEWRVLHPGGTGAGRVHAKLRAESVFLAQHYTSIDAVRPRSRDANFIILCHPDTLAQEGHSPILAESFAEFLQKAQDSAGTYWWLRPNFTSYGDAITGMKRNDH